MDKSKDSWILIRDRQPETKVYFSYESIYAKSDKVKFKTYSGYEFIGIYKFTLFAESFTTEPYIEIENSKHQLLFREVQYWKEIKE